MERILGIQGLRGRVGSLLAQLATQQGWTVVDVGRAPQYDLEGCGVVADFSSPEGTLALATALRGRGVPLVVGTTGHTVEQEAQLRSWSAEVAILKAPNFAWGVLVLKKLIEQAALLLGPSYDTAVLDIHRKHKRDAPSGTALGLAKAIECEAVTSLRLGENPGEHSVYFEGLGERLELTHRAYDRSAYAQGALRAAEWIQKKPAGWYRVDDIWKK